MTYATYADPLKNHLRPTIKSKRRGRSNIGVLLQHDNARPHTVRSTVAKIRNQSFECLSHSSYRQPRPPVTFMFLDRSRRWEASVSGPTKKCNRLCRSGCALSQKIFFSRGKRALPKSWNTVWNAMETTQKNEVIVYLSCSINYEIKIFKGFI